MPAASTIHSQARPPRLVQKLHNYCFYGFLPSLPDHDYVWYVTPCYQTYMSDSKGDSDSGWTLQWEIWSHWDAALLTDTTNVELFNEENGVLVASTCFHIAFDEWNSIVLPMCYCHCLVIYKALKVPWTMDIDILYRSKKHWNYLETFYNMWLPGA